jgi:predicted transcriptional regulator
MARTQTMVQLTDDLIELLDAEAQRRGVSRSSVIREAVTSHLAAAREAQLDAAIVAGYLRIPPGTPDEWGDLSAQADAATEDVLQRLDAEGRAAGASW